MDKHLIAVVDDEVDLLDNFRALLEDQFDIAAFTSPKDFLKALPELKEKNCRLLVTDFKMPGMTGLEMVQRAHELMPHLPFIILSGFLDKNTVLDAVNIGAFSLLEKPTDHEHLMAAIDQLIVESELQIVRREIRTLTSQLRELYSSIRLVLSQYIPEDLMDRLVVDAPDGKVQKKMSFEDLLENLEFRLDQLLKTEKMMNELKNPQRGGKGLPTE